MIRPRSRVRQLALLASAMLACPACSVFSKEEVPKTPAPAGARVPTQQRLVALAVDEAVDKLDFGSIAGKQVDVQVTGVLPHSPEELLFYIDGAVKGKLARSGAVVMSTPQTGQTAPVPVPIPFLSLASEGAAAAAQAPNVDYHLIVGVEWGGIDTLTTQKVLKDRLGMQAGTIAAGVAAGIGMMVYHMKWVGEETAVTAVTGGAIWAYAQPPVYKVYTLTGRVRLSVNGIPMKGGTAFATAGQGESSIVVDPTDSQGYMVQGDVLP